MIVKTKSGELLLVRIPEDTTWWVITNDLPEGYWEILGRFSELKNEVFKEFVETRSKLFYRDYTEPPESKWLMPTAKQSFQSLCKSQGIDDDLDNYLIIKPDASRT